MSSLLFAGAVLLVLLMGWRGWRLGIVRQTLSILALALAYVCGVLFGGFLVPVLRPAGFPDRVLSILGGVIVGMIVYFAGGLIGAVLFKRTSQQSVGLIRFGFGISGALLGAAFGVFLVFVSMIGIRLLGTLAEAEGNRPAHAGSRNPMSTRLAGLKRSLADSPASAILDKVDPVPGAVYETLGKVGEVTASPERIERFVSDKAVQRVAAHPKIAALQEDPEVARAVREGDFISLLRHPKVIEAANDSEVTKLLGEFDFQKALDHSLRQPQKVPVR